MANSVVADPSAPPQSNAAAIGFGTTSMDDLGDPLPFPPMDLDYFSQIEGTLIDDLDFDFSFDDFDLPSDVDSFLDPNFLPGSVDQHGAAQVDPACYLQSELRNHSPPELNSSGSRSQMVVIRILRSLEMEIVAAVMLGFSVALLQSLKAQVIAAPTPLQLRILCPKARINR
nr:bZIP transcription factor 17-like isoform X1 [Ipomoea batatas]